MNARTLLDNFDLLADAPGGVPKLRELILQLAVRGKLVPQEKGRRGVHHEEHEGHEGKKDVERIEGPYAVPEGWRWTTLAQVGKVNPRNEADDDLEVGFAPMAVISDRYGVTPEYERRFWRDVRKGFTHFAEGDVGLAKITPCFENGKSAVFRNVPNAIGAGTTELHVFRPVIGTVIPDYVWAFLKSPGFRTGGEAVMTGSAGQKRVPSDYFANTPFPLPPLSEQKRIVARVDELMKRCDELEARQKERNERHTVLVSSCLHALADPTKSKTSLPAVALAEAGSFNLLFSSPSSVAELRKTILQLAVQGRLVRQDPKDKCAMNLSGRPVVSSSKTDNLPSLPKHWEWCILGEAVTRMDSGWSPACDDEPSSEYEWGILKTTSVQRMEFQQQQNKRLPSSLAPRPEHQVNTGDILFTRAGPVNRVGIVCVARPTRTKLMISDKIIRFRLGSSFDPDFTVLALNAGYSSTVIERMKSGMAASQVNVSQANLRKVPIPLPPLAEQKRIVAKVNELMALCDVLEAKLTQSRADADTLAAAVVHQLCSGSVHSKEMAV